MLSKRVTSRAICLIVAAGLLVSLWVWLIRPGSELRVAVRVIPEEGRAEVRQVKLPLGSSADKRPVTTVQVDLGRWAGQLVRLEVEGKLRARAGSKEPAGFAGCSASVSDGTGSRPLEFVGWANAGKERLHLGTLGPTTFRGPNERGATFVYAHDGRLWQVLSVGPRQRLTVSLTPVLAADVGRGEERYTPPAPRPWRPAAKVSWSGGRQAPDVFIYLIDALRADHLGCYRYPRPTSPTIDRFAAGAVVYEQAQTASTWTKPSVASLFTGLYPLAHGVMHMDSDKLDQWPVTLPEALRAAGYRTMHITTNGHTSGHYGFLQGVDDSVFENVQSAPWAVAQAAKFLRRARPNQPVFMYVHTLEPHEPYAPRPETFKLFDRSSGQGGGSSGAPQPGDHPSAAEIEHLLDLYDAEIRDGDAGFAAFLELLRRTGRFEDSLIIVLADHGESFGEHGAFCHGRTLSAEEMRVPLIIRYPGGAHAGARVKTRVSLVDVYPTVIAAAGARPMLSYGLPGRDLTEVAVAPSSAPEVPIYVEVSKHANNKLDLVGLIDEQGYKRVFNMSVEGGGPASPSALGLWDTGADPGERRDLIASLPFRAAYEETLMARYLMAQRWWRGAASTGTTASAALTPSMREHLKALGYLK